MHVAPQTSDYPVILSLENHCSMEQQEVLAQQLKDILGEQLLTATIDGRVPTQLPSPEVGTDCGHAGHRCPAWEWGEEVALLSRREGHPFPSIILLCWSIWGLWGYCLLMFTGLPKLSPRFSPHALQSWTAEQSLPILSPPGC